MWMWIVGVGAVLAALVAAVTMAVRWYQTPDDNQDNLAVLVPGGLLIQTALVEGDLGPMIEKLNRHPSDSNARYEALHLTASEDAYPRSKRLLAAHPGESNVALIHGANAIKAGWALRGNGRAEDVDPSVWPHFFERLNEALEALELAARLDERDPTPIAFMMIAAKGLDLPIAELDALVSMVHSREASHYATYRNAMEARSKKWGGSHEDMFEMITEAAQAAPFGHPARALSLFGHLMVWQWHSVFDDNDDSATEYLSRTAVRSDIERAVVESALHPDALASAAMNQVCNDAAYLYATIGDKKAAKRMFERIGPRWTATPWSYMSVRPGTTFRLSRWFDT